MGTSSFGCRGCDLVHQLGLEGHEFGCGQHDLLAGPAVLADAVRLEDVDGLVRPGFVIEADGDHGVTDTTRHLALLPGLRREARLSIRGHETLLGCGSNLTQGSRKELFHLSISIAYF